MNKCEFIDICEAKRTEKDYQYLCLTEKTICAYYEDHLNLEEKLPRDWREKK